MEKKWIRIQAIHFIFTLSQHFTLSERLKIITNFLYLGLVKIASTETTQSGIW